MPDLIEEQVSTPEVPGTDLTPLVEKKEDVTPPEKFKVGDEELTGAEIAEKYKGSVSKMHESTQEAAELRKQNAALQGQVDGAKQAVGGESGQEPTDAEVESQIAQFRVNYEDEKADALKEQLRVKQITRDVTAQVTQTVRAESFGLNKARYMEAVKQAHPEEFEAVREELEKVNPTFAMQLAGAWGIENPLEAAFEFHAVRGRRKAAAEGVKRAGSFVPAASVGGVTVKETDDDDTLTANEKHVAHRMFSQLSHEEAEKQYLDGKKLPDRYGKIS